MTADTLVNESPMVADLEFDVGEVLKCRLRSYVCPNEAEWLASMHCGCAVDVPGCHGCKADHIKWISTRSVDCLLCNAPVRSLIWKPL